VILNDFFDFYDFFCPPALDAGTPSVSGDTATSAG